MVAAGISRPPLTTEHPRISAIFLRMPKPRNGSFTNRPPISNGGRNEAKRPKAGCSAALYLMIPSQVMPNRVTVPIAAKLRYRLMEGSGICRNSHGHVYQRRNAPLFPSCFSMVANSLKLPKQSQRFLFGKSSRMPRNSCGPLIRRRFRCARSSLVAVWSPRRSTSRPAMSAALRWDCLREAGLCLAFLPRFVIAITILVRH
jgi:hypothetical protein